MDPFIPDSKSEDTYHLPQQRGKVIQPLPGQLGPNDANPAAELIRQKLRNIYGEEPSAKEEEAEAEIVPKRSKHQQFMYDLSHSGKSLADIQTEWHNYYIGLPDNEKHEVWQEFYATHSQINQTYHAAQPKPAPQPAPEPLHTVEPPKQDTRTVSDVKTQLLSKVQTRSRLKHTDHLKSLAFGLGMGVITILIVMFGFFNERFIAPFMTPSRAVSNTPLLIDPNTVAVGPTPKIIVPKINAEIPIVYDVPDIKEESVQKGLERGVVHYPTTPMPGEKGNGVVFGHSSNNIFNVGSYKYAFVLLHKVELGDTFFIETNGKRYVYKIYEKKVVKPTAVDILLAQDKPATFTLVTCDPPGSNANRLVVIGEQISPDPATNGKSTAKADTTDKTTILPSNSPTLWSRFWKWLAS